MSVPIKEGDSVEYAHIIVCFAWFTVCEPMCKRYRKEPPLLQVEANL